MIEKIYQIKKNTDSEADMRDDLIYWLSKSTEERIEAVEKLRKDFWGEDYEDKQGFSRIFKITRHT